MVKAVVERSNINELSTREQQILQEFQKRFEGELEPHLKNDTNMFIRFLRARDFQIDVAEDMLKKHLLWRKANQIDTILTDFVPNEVARKYLYLYRIGFDKEGSPIRYFAFGNTDAKGILKSARKSDMIKTAVLHFEDDNREIKKNNLEHGTSMYQWTYIVDCDGFNLSKATHKPTIETLFNLFQTYEANYPERLKIAYIINSSMYFMMLFSAIKPFLTERTVNKIHFYGKDNWKSELLKLIDFKVLPKCLGGENTDIDYSYMKMVPEKYYITKNENHISSLPGAKKLIVPRKSKYCLPVEVEKSNSVIEWDFETDSGDINFGLSYKANVGLPEELLLPPQKIECHVLAENGMYKCDKPGTYTLIFDNSYSWIHRKEIYCRVTITPHSQS